MSKKLVSTILCALLFCSVYAQKPPVKFGDILIENLKMTRFEKDTSASAVILADYGVSSIEYDESEKWFKLIFERTTQIKILKTDGYSYADFEVPLYHTTTDEEKLLGLKVVTHNLENGKDQQIKMKPDAIFEEEYDPNTNIKKFTAPNVKVGSIVEVTYKITSDFLHYFRDWEFQSEIPVVWSEYRANIPEYYNYEQYMQGYVTLALNETKSSSKILTVTSKERTIDPRTGFNQTNVESENIPYTENNFRWISKDVPAFKEEPFMTSKTDYVSKINFELSFYKFPNEPVKQIMGSWGDLNKSFLESEYFGLPVKGSGFLNKILDEIAPATLSPQEKITAVYNYVKGNVEWDGQSRKFVDHDFRKVLEQKKGSSADINLLLTSMLQKAGFTANPVLISTRSNGFVRESSALSSQFNYVICQVTLDGKNILLDATDRMLPIHMLPERCLNGRGYVISKDASGWVTLSAPKSKVHTSADLSLSPDGTLKGKMDISHDGYFGYHMRKEYFKNGETEYVKDFTHRMSWEIEKSKFENLNNLNEAAKEAYEFTHADNFGDASTIYINPILYERVESNPFKLENRIYPVNFSKPTEITFVCKLTIPENFFAEEIPSGKIFAMPNNGARYTYNIIVTGNVITLTSIFSINQSLFVQNEYAALREFYNHVVSKQSEQIVLKKKS